MANKPAAAPQINPAQLNAQQRAIMLQGAVEMTQSIASGTLSGVIPGQVVNIQPRNVGFIKKFIIELEFDLTQSAAEPLTRSKLGPANILSQVVYTDLSNQTRVNTAGWHLHALATPKAQSAFGASFTSDTPTGYGSNFKDIDAPAAVTTGAKVRMFF